MLRLNFTGKIGRRGFFARPPLPPFLNKVKELQSYMKISIMIRKRMLNISTQFIQRMIASINMVN